MPDEHDGALELIDDRGRIGGVGRDPAKGRWRRENRVVVTVETVEHGAPARSVSEGAVDEEDGGVGHASAPALRVPGSRPCVLLAGCTGPARARDQGALRARPRWPKS